MANLYANYTTSAIAGGAGGSGTSFGSGDASLLLPSGDGAKYPSAFPFMIQLGTPSSTHELCRVFGRSGDTLTGIIRGDALAAPDTTSKYTWPVGTAVSLVLTAGEASSSLFNVLTYGAKGNDSSHDDRAGIQAALDACRLAGGGTVRLPAGTYYLDSCPVHPVDNTINSTLVQGSNTMLVGDGKGATILKWKASSGTTNIPNQGRMLTNYNRLSPGGDTDLVVRGIAFDGNAGNMPGSVDAQYGVQCSWVQRLLYDDVIARDFYGTTSAGNGSNGTPGENFHLDAHYSRDVKVRDCIVYDSGVNKTASGFSFNYCTSVQVVDCSAYGLHFSRCFTHFHCAAIKYVGCHAYLGGLDGFNSEFTNDAVYVDCTAGGVSSDNAMVTWGASTTLGNSNHGFRVYNSIGKHLHVGCSSFNNGAAGISYESAATGPLLVDGGFYTGNTTYGVKVDGGSTGIRFVGRPTTSGNGTNDLLVLGTTATVTSGQVTAPSVPLTTANMSNPYPFPCSVCITGGTITRVDVCGVQVVGSPSTFFTPVVPPGQNIKLTYTGSPAWSWYSLL